MIRPTKILPCVLLALASCAPESEPESASESAAEAEAPALKLYVFDCGRVRFDDEQLDAFDFGLTSDETDVRELIAPCYVVEHERGRLLWEGGLPLATAETEGWQDADGKQLRLDRKLGDQLADIDLDFTAFDYVAFSHMHYDHVGVANELEGATLLIQRPEYESRLWRRNDRLRVPARTLRTIARRRPTDPRR